VVWGYRDGGRLLRPYRGQHADGDSEERVVPRSIEQPLSPGRVKALAKGADAVVIEGRHARPTEKGGAA